MSDRIRELREALETPQWPAERNAEWHRAQDTIREFAHRHLALMESLQDGGEIQWCETHEAVKCHRHPHKNHCNVVPESHVKQCRFAFRLLVDPVALKVET